MNRTGLIVALYVALVTGLIFALFPQLDVVIAHLFYDKATGTFLFNPRGNAEYVRRAAMWIAWGFAAPAFIAPLFKLIRPDKPLLISGRAIVFFLTTIFLTAIVLPNIIFKEHWGRPRPIMTVEFSGTNAFKPWWDPRGDGPHNGSFFSGEAATAFWTYAPAALAPAAVRPLAFGAATLFGLTTGLLRMAFGGHYASDILAAGVAAFLVTWVGHGFIYRWKRSRLTDEQVDRWLADLSHKIRSAKSFWRLFAIVMALTALRLLALRFSVVDLFPDEARYWAWGQAPAYGYFSKPPLIAWIIGEFGRLFGTSEWSVRAPSALFYAGTALVGYWIAHHLYGARTAFWAGLCIAFGTGVAFSSRIISTDVPLMFFWAVALLAYFQMLDRRVWPWWIILGLALGFGLLAKYAMIYFLLGALAAALVDARARTIWRTPALWSSLVLGSLIMTPNIVWNATHGYATFRHTWGNAIGQGLHIDPLGALEFIAGQFGVCGPIILATVLFIFVWRTKFPLAQADRILLAFAVPLLTLITALALIAGAEANWAAPSALGLTIVAAAMLVRHNRRGWLVVSIAIGLITQVTLAVTDAFADRLSVPFLAQPDIYHRTLGWKAMASRVRQEAAANGIRTIAANQNDVTASLLYYLRDDKWRIVSWPNQTKPSTQFDIDRPLTAAAPEPILFVSSRCYLYSLTDYYARVERVASDDVPTGPHSTRHFCMFKLSGVAREIAPLREPH